MRIVDLIDRRSVCVENSVMTKDEAINRMVNLMYEGGGIMDKDAYLKQVLERESECSTGMEAGIAIPHGKCSAVTRPSLAAMVLKQAVDFDAADGQPVNLIFMIASPDTADNSHLDVLSQLSLMLLNDSVTAALRGVESVDEFLNVMLSV